MSQQIRVMEKSVIDISRTGVVLAVTDAVATNDGTDFLGFLRDRKNTSGWGTTGSTDAANTQLEVTLASATNVSNILLINHNFEDYLLEYNNGTSWITVESVSGNLETSNYHNFTAVYMYAVRLTITAAQVVDADKLMSQLIIADNLQDGQFKAFPTISGTKHKTNKKLTTMLSGKALISEGTGAFECSLSVKILKDNDDLNLIESMYSNKEGFLVTLGGGDEDQFSSKRQGYRKEDVYFMRCVDDYSDDFYKSLYTSGVKIKIKLREAIR